MTTSQVAQYISNGEFDALTFTELTEVYEYNMDEVMQDCIQDAMQEPPSLYL